MRDIGLWAERDEDGGVPDKRHPSPAYVRLYWLLFSVLNRALRADGTLRWQAPELMSGHSGLTQEVDVYAFAITCVELLTKGKLPWPMADDDAVRFFVLRMFFSVVVGL